VREFFEEEKTMPEEKEALKILEQKLNQLKDYL